MDRVARGGSGHGVTPVHLTATVERWPVAGAFTIARGAKTHVDVVVATATADAATGRGESTPIYYHGETAEGVAAQIAALGTVPLDRQALLGRLPRGAARNAVDAALLDLEARLAGRPVWGDAPPSPVLTAFTISLADPARMEADARAAAARHPLLKLKLAGEGDLDRVAAVRRGAPDARLIVDANEAWGARDVAAEAAALVPFGVELIEQPVPAGQDHLLDGVTAPIPLCADESCQDLGDLSRCLGRYQAINIKLDKTGGLTAALALAAQAERAGMALMVGCMLGTSLGIAPAFLLADRARWIDLDAPLLLARDRPDGAMLSDGLLHPPSPSLWGGGR